ncbi:hypothetical protein PO878_17230 [Iamia majanohamensis]|uniref:AlpA family phage regulatory protein n=1 Tax=Iamia majanohamensis TaxID=467976 RepID=A0AAF0BT31_9ACTN|nr:hypothetical protein [Iamia majanohamensis]WCO66247.1 hypothetical protein PO878_17230 [Iamia majanohamensis]
MGRMVDAGDLVDAVLIAERLGLSHSQNVHKLRERHEDFPAPVATLGRLRIWLWSEIEAWARATGRLR